MAHRGITEAYAEAYTLSGRKTAPPGGASVGAGLEAVGDADLERFVVDSGQVDPLFQDPSLEILRNVHRGENAVDLLAFVAGEELVEFAEDAVA